MRGCVTNGHSGPPPEMIDRMPKLEIIASASVGYDGIPVEYARSKGIPVCNTPEVLNDDVADLAIALMIMTARKLVVTDRYVRSGEWPKNGEYPLANRASGKRVGILGMGRIGKEIGKRADGDEQHGRLSQPHARWRTCRTSIIPTWWSWRRTAIS